MMKRLTSLVLAVLLLASCSHDTPVTTYETAETEKSYLYPMEDFEVKRIKSYLSTSLEQIIEVSEFRSQADCSGWTTAPMLQIIGDKTYLMRRFPEELIGFDALNGFDKGEGAENYENQIEIYTGGDYSVPAEVITLSGHSDRMLRFDAFEYLPESDTFITLQAYYHIDDPQVFTIRTFDGEGRMLSQKDIVPPSMDMEEYPFIELRLAGGDLYFAEKETNVYRYDIDTDTETLVNGGINGFTVSDGKIVYLRHTTNKEFEVEYRVCEYVPEQNASFILGKFACNPEKQLIQKNHWMNIAFDRAASTIYYDARVYSSNLPSGIRTARLNEEDYTQVLVTSEGSQYIKNMQIFGDRLLLQVGNNQILMYEVPETSVAFDRGVQTLNFCLYYKYQDNAPSYESDTFMRMEMSGTKAKAGVTVLMSDPAEYANTMAKKLLAGDTDFDIFMVTTEITELLKEGYYEDLSEYRLLDTMFGEMIPGMKNLCTIGDTLALCPITVVPSRMKILSRFFDGDITPPASVKELANLADTMTGSNTRILAGYWPSRIFMPWLNQFTTNFMIRRMEDEQAKADLTELYRIAAGLMKNEKVAYGDRYQSYMSAVFVEDNHGKSSGVPEGTIMCPIPAVGEGYAQTVEGSFYAVNPNSPNKELAAEFLACYMDRDRSNHNNFYETWNPEFTYGEGSEKLFDLFKKQIADGVIMRTVPDLAVRADVHLTAIVEGTITPEAAAEELYRYLRQVRDE